MTATHSDQQRAARHRCLRALGFAFGAAVLCYTGVLQLTWPQQIVVGAVSVLIATWIDRGSSSYLVTLSLMVASMHATFRYAFWRLSTVAHFFTDGASAWGPLDAFFIGTLVLAETYAFVILFLGYLQTLWPLRRKPTPLPGSTEEWPAIDLLIPTYNEPLSVVRSTALASLSIDWPPEKLNIYLLDDGKREEFRQFAKDAGLRYITRENNQHAKAGNINQALKQMTSPLVAIFDCDHVPTRSFFQMTAGWFLRDDRLGMLQTPHHFYSPDPFERNLGQFRAVPNEGELFYGVIQDANDFWNATFFCGSCAILRRSALDEIGGIAVETVTEDAHTSLRMQMNGWNTAYINIPQAAGLATERLSGHIKQRTRWARGMIQILRTDNPLLAKGLRPMQRLCYFNAMTHFLYALPRLIFLFAPLIYLLLGHTNVPGSWTAIFAYAFPHLVLSSMTNSRIQGQHRHSFWNEIYETVLAPYILLPTMLALFSPKLGKFNVTAKGGVVNRQFFDSRIALPFLVMLGFNIAGLFFAIPRFWEFPHVSAAVSCSALLNLPASMYDGAHTGTVLMNVLWTGLNSLILGVALGVAMESAQRRQTVRVTMQVAARVRTSTGEILPGTTADVSSGGVMMHTDEPASLRSGDAVHLLFQAPDGEKALPAVIVRVSGTELRAQFDALSIEQEGVLTQVLYGRADTWLGWAEAHGSDRPLHSMLHILSLALRGLEQTFHALTMQTKRRWNPARAVQRLKVSVVPRSLLLLATFGLLGSLAQGKAQGRWSNTLRSSTRGPSSHESIIAPGPHGNSVRDPFHSTFSLRDAGVSEPVVLAGLPSSRSVYFSLGKTEVPRTAQLRLRYTLSSGLLSRVLQLKISINDLPFATVPGTAPATATLAQKGSEPARPPEAAHLPAVSAGTLLETTLQLPAELLVQKNKLTFELTGQGTPQHQPPSDSAARVWIDPETSLTLESTFLTLPDELRLLPLPFYDNATDQKPVIQIAFATEPSPKAIQAAGVVASWFGMLADFRPLRFSVSVGALPRGNVIFLSEGARDLPAPLALPPASGPFAAMRSNPADPSSRVLVLAGRNVEDLVQAAQALATEGSAWVGSETIILPRHPGQSEPDDAPRWLPTERVIHLRQAMDGPEIEGDGSTSLTVYMRLPPNLNYGTHTAVPLRLAYRYNAVPLAVGSTLDVTVNGAVVGSVSLPHTNNASETRQATLAVPVGVMRPFSQTISVRFRFQPAAEQPGNAAAGDLHGAVLGGSSFDLRGLPHIAPLPNLELFANAGYPFTRLKDLSQTAVIMPSRPSVEEIEVLLTLLSHFSAQTGFPAINLTVSGPDGLRADKGKDYLVLGMSGDQPFFNLLNATLPVTIGQAGLQVQDTQGIFGFFRHAWWRVRPADYFQKTRLVDGGDFPDALIEGMEWPRASHRSVIVVALRDGEAVPNFLTGFLRSASSSDIAQTVSVLHGTQFTSYRVGSGTYRVGKLTVGLRFSHFFADNPEAAVAVILVSCVLLALLVRAAVFRRASLRVSEAIR